jgi:hypothetical protein
MLLSVEWMQLRPVCLLLYLLTTLFHVWNNNKQRSRFIYLIWKYFQTYLATSMECPPMSTWIEPKVMMSCPVLDLNSTQVWVAVQETRYYIIINMLNPINWFSWITTAKSWAFSGR